jgi:hypothetical protein
LNDGFVAIALSDQAQLLQSYLSKLNSERKPELTRTLGLFPVHITKNKANPKR